MTATPESQAASQPDVSAELNKFVIEGLLPRDAARRTSLENIEDVLNAITARYGRLYVQPAQSPIRPELVQSLIDIGTGKLQHLQMGACPDHIEGHETRDSDCPACKVLVEAAAYVSAQALTDAELEQRTGEPHVDGYPLYSGLPPAPAPTPRSDAMEALRKSMGQERTPAYGDALRLCRELEAELHALRAGQVQAHGADATAEERAAVLAAAKDIGLIDWVSSDSCHFTFSDHEVMSDKLVALWRRAGGKAPAATVEGQALLDEIDLVRAVLDGYPNGMAKADALRAVRVIRAAMTAAPPAPGADTLPVRRQDVEMAGALLAEAAQVLEGVGPEVLEKLPNWRWPLTDELGGAGGIMKDYLKC